MSSNTGSNKLIFKNTVLLYLRMFVILGITLYTSRVVLSTLGIIDYGIYNVVGGVVSMFTFISMAMSNATSRYITVALGKADANELCTVFNVSLFVHAMMAVLILVLSETVGLWFLINKLQIPVERMVAAHWTYQFSIIAAILTIFNSPFNALIIAHEKMAAFAYISILDVFLKLGIVYLLVVSSADKLIMYSALFLGINILDFFLYYIYCKRKFEETKIVKVRDARLVKEISSFAGWSMIGNLAGICYTQGLNILLNMFFGPVVNAARGVAVQVQSATKGFVTNFQTAINPQLTKSYAQNDFERMHFLLFWGSKFSFFLLLCIILPIIIEADFILSLWLEEVPDYSVTFVQLILLITLIDTFERPVTMSMNSTGSIRLYQIVSCSIQLLILPIAYVFIRLGCVPETVFIVQFIVLIIAFITELHILKDKIELDLSCYFKEVGLKITITFLLSLILSIALKSFLPTSFLTNLLMIPSVFLIVWIIAFSVGMNKVERQLIISKIKRYLRT